LADGDQFPWESVCQPPGAERPISFDQIMDALCKLDDDMSGRTTSGELRHNFDRLDA
jgi:hypothetical protein